MKNRAASLTGRKAIQESSDPGSLLIVVYVAVVVLFILLGSFSRAPAQEKLEDWQSVRLGDVEQGELLVKEGDSSMYRRAPLVSQQVKIGISGMVAEAKLRQRFHNDSVQWLEAVYVFPLPDESAITHMRMIIGERVIVGKIQEKEKARQTYIKAKQEGKKTSLLAQKRPNIFTMAVANIPPQSSVEVEIEFLDSVRLDKNTFSYRFPMVVGPRYIPGRALDSKLSRVSFDGEGWAADTDEVEDASEITPAVAAPNETSSIPVELALLLSPGFPVKNLASLYHGIRTTEQQGNTYQVHFDGRVFADRDFVLEYQAANENDIGAALFSQNSAGEYFGYVMVTPPVQRVEYPLPREVIFVLDVSGSMAGSSIRQAKAALQYAISRLQNRDQFNIIVFNNRADKLYSRPQAATPENRMAAQRRLGLLEASGGTEIAKALKLALDSRMDHRRIRQVVFLTDGAVGNERSLLSVIENRLGDARLFTVGIGSAPNSFFMTRAAKTGRGSYTFIGEVAEVEKQMAVLLEKLERPVITDLSLRRSDGGSVEIYPDPLPDLYSGEPLTALVRAKAPLHAMELRGNYLGREWNREIPMQSGNTQGGIASLWARKKIRSLMGSLRLGAEEAEIRRQVVGVALKHGLVSRYTSLVAVEEQVSRDAAENMTSRQVKNHLPQGWQYNKVFGSTAQTATRAQAVLYLGTMLLAAGLLIIVSAKRRVPWADPLPKK